MRAYALVDVDALIAAGLLGSLAFYLVIRIGAWLMR